MNLEISQGVKVVELSPMLSGKRQNEARYRKDNMAYSASVTGRILGSDAG